MSELDELYQELILDHNKNPRNFKIPPGASHKAEGHNPLCGDKITIYLKLEDGVVKDIGFQGSGCAISKASASLLTERIKEKNKAEAINLFEIIHALLTGDGEAKIDRRLVGKLSAFEGVRKFPARVKCATLAWHTLKAALENKENIVFTE